MLLVIDQANDEGDKSGLSIFPEINYASNVPQ